MEASVIFFTKSGGFLWFRVAEEMNRLATGGGLFRAIIPCRSIGDGEIGSAVGPEPRLIEILV